MVKQAVALVGTFVRKEDRCQARLWVDGRRRIFADDVGSQATELACAQVALLVGVDQGAIFGLVENRRLGLQRFLCMSTTELATLGHKDRVGNKEVLTAVVLEFHHPCPVNEVPLRGF